MGSINGQYEKGEWLQQEKLLQCPYGHPTINLRQTWKIVKASFNVNI